MIESVNPAKCGSYQMHGPHDYRPGFFRSLRRCMGTPFPEDFVPPSAALIPAKSDAIPFPDDFESEEETLIPLQIFEHKHCFRLAKGIKTSSGHFLRKPKKDLLWSCDWNDCEEHFIIKRKLWKKQGVPYDVY